MCLDTPDGTVVHAEITLHGVTFSVTEVGCPTPEALGGSAVLVHLDCDDPDAVCGQAVASGAKVVIPVDDRFYGKREGRIQDPFGHLWILSKTLVELSEDEIRARLGG